VVSLPPGLQRTASSPGAPVAAFEDQGRGLYGLQWHPEVAHTEMGQRVIENFLYRATGARPSWTTGNIIEDAIERVRAQVGTGKVLLGLSGGVDSSVVAALLHRAIGAANNISIRCFGARRLDPEMRRVIGEIGEHRDEGDVRGRAVQTLPHGPIQIRHHRDHNIEALFAPEFFKKADGGPVIQPDDTVHTTHELGGPERPAFAQHQVVEILQPHARDLAENVERIEQFLQIDETHLPRPLLRLDDLPQSVGCRAMAAACVKKNQADPLHSLR